jgi:hypothetical protein
VPALEPLHGLRVVADPAALDGARWDAATGRTDQPIVLRFAPDEAFAIGATRVTLDDPDAIIEDERGYVGAWCSFDAIRPQTEWSPPTARPALAQGSIAGVPAKVWLPGDGEVLVIATAAHAAGLAERLGWSR